MFTKIHLTGDLPDGFLTAFAELSGELGLTQDKTGFPINAQRGDALSVTGTADRVLLTWAEPVQLYRALSHLRSHEPGEVFAIFETPRFETVGVMLDVSRGAVLRPETIRSMLRKMALMGLNLGMLYTEDTYEVPGLPYFGYQRGRYSQEGLRALDDYAFQFGIELCPCIQTLAHLNRVLHWPAMAHLKDTEEVLLPEYEETYRFIDQMVVAAAAPYRSRRIHIGMDEAAGLGLGRYLLENSYKEKSQLMRRHLERVSGIVQARGLKAMMWSDMFFRPESATGGYYDGGEPSPEIVSAVCPDIDLVYWDYYHSAEADYAAMLEKHKKLPAKCFFAGAVWTMMGPAPDFDKTFATSLPGLRAAYKAGVPLALATVWGDNGGETNLRTALPGLQLYAEYNYRGDSCTERFSERLEACCGSGAANLLALTRFNAVPGMRSGPLRPVNAAKFLLYEDPLVPLFEKDMENLPASAHYEQLREEFSRLAAAEGEYADLMGFFRDLASLLSLKCAWHETAGRCVRSGDRAVAVRLSDSVGDILAALETLRESWSALWYVTNKPWGFEIIDLRLGGLVTRFRTAERRMRTFAHGGDPIDELLEIPLPYTKRDDGTLFGSYAWGEIVSAGKIDI